MWFDSVRLRLPFSVSDGLFPSCDRTFDFVRFRSSGLSVHVVVLVSTPQHIIGAYGKPPKPCPIKYLGHTVKSRARPCRIRPPPGVGPVNASNRKCCSFGTCTLFALGSFCVMGFWVVA